MKKTVIFILSGLVILTGSLHACGSYTPPAIWRAGILLVGNYHYDHMGPYPELLPGIHAVRLGQKWDLRIGLERHGRSVRNIAAPHPDLYQISGYEKHFVVRAGIQKRWRKDKALRPYAALDLGFQYGQSDLTHTGGFTGWPERYFERSWGGGFMPALGIEYQLGRFVLMAETRAEAMITHLHVQPTYYSGNVDSRPYRVTQYDFNSIEVIHAGLQFQL